MSIWNNKENIEEIKRIIEILETFFHYGLEDVLDEVNIVRELNIPLFKKKEVLSGIKRKSMPERMRLAFEKLGPAFVKFGQFLSTRPDILPYEYIMEFEKLQSDVTRVPFYKIKSQIHNSLGKTIDKLFVDFDRKPVAAASMSQVHAAILPNGTKVAVKVKRPDIDEVIYTDTKIIWKLAKFLKNKQLVNEVWKPVELSEQFERTLKDELDFKIEIANQKKFFLNFVDEPSIKIPKVFDEYSSDCVITMEYVKGMNINKVARSRSKKYVKEEIAKIGERAIFKQVFVDYFFHGDLHPGNILWLEKEQKICFIDFGIVGNLHNDEVKALSLMLSGILSFDSEKILLGIEGLDIINSSRQADCLKREVYQLLEKYYNAVLKEVKIATLIQEIFNLMLKLRISLPINLVKLAKTFMMAEGLAEKLDPDFCLFEFAKPYVAISVKKQIDYKNIKNKIENKILRSSQLLESLPEDLQWFLRNLKNNDFKIKIEHQKLHYVLAEIAQTGNRLSASLIVAGLVVGSSYIMPTFKEVGLIGYFIAFLIGIGIIVGMMRKNKL